MIKNMNSKMTTNSQVLKSEPKKYKNKNKLSKQLEQEQIYKNRDHMEGYQWGGQGMGEKVQGIRSINSKQQVQNRHGEVKNSVGNGEAKELICTTHGHQLRRGGHAEGWGVARQRGRKGRKKLGQL